MRDQDEKGDRETEGLEGEKRQRGREIERERGE